MLWILCVYVNIWFICSCLQHSYLQHYLLELSHIANTKEPCGLSWKKIILKHFYLQKYLFWTRSISDFFYFLSVIMCAFIFQQSSSSMCCSIAHYVWFTNKLFLILLPCLNFNSCWVVAALPSLCSMCYWALILAWLFYFSFLIVHIDLNGRAALKLALWPSLSWQALLQIRDSGIQMGQFLRVMLKVKLGASVTPEMGCPYIVWTD